MCVQNVGIATDQKGRVTVNDRLQTNVPRCVGVSLCCVCLCVKICASGDYYYYSQYWSACQQRLSQGLMCLFVC